MRFWFWSMRQFGILLPFLDGNQLYFKTTMIYQALVLSHSPSCGEDQRCKMFHAPCQELPLSTDAFSPSHGQICCGSRSLYNSALGWSRTTSDFPHSLSPERNGFIQKTELSDSSGRGSLHCNCSSQLSQFDAFLKAQCLSKYIPRPKAQQYFVSLSYVFLDGKTMSKNIIWLNLGLNLTVFEEPGPVIQHFTCTLFIHDNHHGNNNFAVQTIFLPLPSDQSTQSIAFKAQYSSH